MKQLFKCNKSMYLSRKGTKWIAFETVYDKWEYAFGIIMQDKEFKAQVNYNKTMFSKEQKYRFTARMLT